MGGFSIWHILIFAIILLLLFGGNRFSSMMGDVAKGLKSFKQGMADEEDDKRRRYEDERRREEVRAREEARAWDAQRKRAAARIGDVAEHLGSEPRCPFSDAVQGLAGEEHILEQERDAQGGSDSAAAVGKRDSRSTSRRACLSASSGIPAVSIFLRHSSTSAVCSSPSPNSFWIAFSCSRRKYSR